MSQRIFFGFNNGITVITKKVYPYYKDTAKKISVSGIQIINGAQTVKSIAEAYKKAKPAKQKEMAEKLIISMKTIVVDNPKLEQDIIQFTNTQTPIEPRDYHSNDLIQSKIYYDLLRYTDVIYERKRGEFENVDREKNRVISNEDMAQAFVAFKLQNPHLARTAPGTIFSSESDVYESIFNKELDYRDLYNSYEVYSYVDKRITEMKNQKKNDSDIEEKYKYLKDARYYLTALIKIIYTDCDSRFNLLFEESNKKHKNKNEDLADKDKTARSILFGALAKHENGTLDESFELACDVLKLYSEMVKSANIYSSKNAYNNILSIYRKTEVQLED